jgi:hypothetical protein
MLGLVGVIADKPEIHLYHERFRRSYRVGVRIARCIASSSRAKKIEPVAAHPRHPAALL